MNRFNILYESILRTISEQSDILSNFIDNSNRRLSRGQKVDTLWFHFYDRSGNEKYILEWRSNKAWFPNAPERLREDFLYKTDMDIRSEIYLKNRIVDSLSSFMNTAMHSSTKTREELREGSPYKVGRAVDADFDYYAWELISSKTGESYAYGLKSDPENFHLGEKMPRGIFVDLEKDAKDIENPVDKNFMLFTYDDEGKNNYMIEFEPTGQYSLANESWTLLANMSLGEMKSRTTPRSKHLFKFLNDAVNATLDKMLELSDTLPDSDETEFPHTKLDKDFYFNEWKLTLNGKDFCHGSKSSKYLKIGAMK